MKALTKSKSEPGPWLEDAPGPTTVIDDVLNRVRRACDPNTQGWTRYTASNRKYTPKHSFSLVKEPSGTVCRDDQHEYEQGDRYSRTLWSEGPGESKARILPEAAGDLASDDPKEQDRVVDEFRALILGY